MAHFIVSASGARGEASRLGTKNSGACAHVRGWDIGVETLIAYDAQNDRDVCLVYRTGGSNGRSARVLVASFYLDANGETIYDSELASAVARRAEVTK